eukprot:SAG11_NODE_17244_length_524_cov_0.917647_1_plen_160_part_01
MSAGATRTVDSEYLQELREERDRVPELQSRLIDIKQSYIDLERENKRIKDGCKRQRQKVSEFERFLVKQSKKLNKHCVSLNYQIRSFGIATEAMSEPCPLCLEFPEVAMTTEQARNGTGTRWVVPRCGHAICSGCLRDNLNPRVVTCSKCNKPLVDFEYS